MFMGANGQIRTSKKKKWKGMSVFGKNDRNKKNAETPPIYTKWALGR